MKFIKICFFLFTFFYLKSADPNPRNYISDSNEIEALVSLYKNKVIESIKEILKESNHRQKLPLQIIINLIEDHQFNESREEIKRLINSFPELQPLLISALINIKNILNIIAKALSKNIPNEVLQTDLLDIITSYLKPYKNELLIRKEDEKKILQSIVFSPDNTKIAYWIGPSSSSTDNFLIVVRDAHTGELLAELDENSKFNRERYLMFYEDGSKLIFNDSRDLRIWDLNETESKCLRFFFGEVKQIISTNGNIILFLFLSSDLYKNTANVEVFNLTKWTKTNIGTCSLRTILSPDGTLVATVIDKEKIKIINVIKGTAKTLEVGSTIEHIAFSKDSSKIACGCSDHLAKVYEVDSGNLLPVLQGHSSNVGTVAFSNDGSKLATASHGDKGNDNSVRIWDVNSGQELQLFNNGNVTWFEPNYLSSLVFSSDDSMLASCASRDNTLRIWSLNPTHG